MDNYTDYEEELGQIFHGLKKTYEGKDNIINELRIHHYIKKIVRLNRKTKNQHIDELMYLVGRTKKQYKNFCRKNNCYTNPYMNKAIKKAFTKLSRKSIAMKTKRSTFKKNGLDMKIEYSSEKGTYEVRRIQKDGTELVKCYKMKNIKNINRKRKIILEKLKRMNYGIDIFDELDVDESKSYRLNPDIIHILLREGKIDYAKMYIKDVLNDNSIMHKPFEVKYELHRDLSRGAFSYEENKAMKRMVKLDRVATNLVIIGTKKRKEIAKTKVSILEKISKLLRTGDKLKTNTDEYVFDSAKVQSIMDTKRKKPVVSNEIAEICKNDEISQSVPAIKSVEHKRRMSENLTRVTYEREVV